jgi:hypothetical protein
MTVFGTTVVAEPVIPLIRDTPPPIGRAKFFDDFNGAAGAGLYAQHTPDLGSPWQAPNPGTGGVFQLTGFSTVHLTANNFLVTDEVDGPEMPADAVYTLRWNNGDLANDDQSFFFRKNPGLGNLYSLTLNSTPKTMTLTRTQGNVVQESVSAPYLAAFDRTISDGTWITIKIVAIGNWIRVYSGDFQALKINYHDTSGMTRGTYIGIGKTFDRPGPGSQFDYVKVNDPLPFNRLFGAGVAFPVLEDDMACRTVQDRIFATYTTKAGEKVWAYQIRREYCSDWVFLSPGLMVDTTQTPPTINTSLGLRVYETVQSKDNTWTVDSTNALDKIGNASPVWTQPAWIGGYIPWSGRPSDLLIEIYTQNGVVLAANSVLELSAALFREEQGNGG